MRWPRRRRDPPAPPERSDGDGRADLMQHRLAARQNRVDELEQWARRERRLNSFSDRMRRGMGGSG